MGNDFQPVLVSWQRPNPPCSWEKFLCKNQTELDYVRAELKGIRYFEQRVYTVEEKRDE